MWCLLTFPQPIGVPAFFILVLFRCKEMLKRRDPENYGLAESRSDGMVQICDVDSVHAERIEGWYEKRDIMRVGDSVEAVLGDDFAPGVVEGMDGDIIR